MIVKARNFSSDSDVSSTRFQKANISKTAKRSRFISSSGVKLYGMFSQSKTYFLSRELQNLKFNNNFYHKN